ncbi:LacI family DNA-binding transcriptional regulator [Streptomyces hoynatensis]|uniref:LacI family transcriptional regulator n=1 Tax=Streptomyces hoynatensis TaxID=1141874 RepID=A0A3A9YV29_9ACTN|nr:LacI family DNA-binding transcriptional regulator [Streptomyces hoynatensis]RKN39825.1 LacI family transcriptional regulator [Streptomyces hoynatensis]
MQKRARPTVRDVAGLAGVSVATVSHVVNGRSGRCTPETRERVLAAIRRLGYVPDGAARGLRRGRTDQVCLIAGSIGVPANAVLAQQLHDGADAAGYGVITLLVDTEARARRAFDLLQQGIADGAIVSDPFRCLDRERLTTLAHSRLSMVVLDNLIEPSGFDVVRIPEREACAEALDHLFASGRRRVAFVGHAFDLVPGAEPTERLAAYLDALERHGVARDEQLTVVGADDRCQAYWTVTGLMQLREPPDALFCASDRAAVSAIWALRDGGFSVPHDVAVIGAGNLREGLVTRPALSTVGPPERDFADVVGLLLDRLSADGEREDRELVRPWSFIPRGSA